MSIIPLAVDLRNGHLVLVLMLVCIASVFGIAWSLNPYDEQGNARRKATHVQMGLPRCTFLLMTKQPCPSCGMTTNVTLMSRGDVENSLQANSVGALLALFAILLVPC